MLLSSLNKIDCSLRVIKATTLRLIGQQAFSQVNEGRELFASFCDLGCAAEQQNIKSLKPISNELVKTTAQLLADNQDWLLLFLTEYPDTIPIEEYSFVTVADLKVRSGLEFMLELYKDIEVVDPGSKYNHNSIQNRKVLLGEVFSYLKEPLADLDAQIKLSQKHWFNIKKEEIPACMPTTHRWWWI